MVSGQTQYYGLSQWEAADKVERVDFNSDNARIPAEQYARLRLVYTISAPSVTSLRVQLNRGDGGPSITAKAVPAEEISGWGDSLEGSSSFRRRPRGRSSSFPLEALGRGSWVRVAAGTETALGVRKRRPGLWSGV